VRCAPGGIVEPGLVKPLGRRDIGPARSTSRAASLGSTKHCSSAHRIHEGSLRADMVGIYRKHAPRKREARATARVSRAALVRTIKRVTMKTAESKSRSSTYDKAELYHNAFGSLISGVIGYQGIVAPSKSLAMPPQGVKDNERVGDQINITGFKVKIMFGQKADRPNVTVRLLVLKIPKGSSITYNNWFTTQTSNIFLDDPNTDFVKVLDSSYLRPDEAGRYDATGGG
jgi:hypothetical protein